MKKKLTFIFIVITLSMLGIIYFQVDWMYKTYKAEFRKINSTADMALKAALSRYHQEHKESIVKSLLPRLSSFYYSVSITSDQLFRGRREKMIGSTDSLLIRLENKHLKSDKKGIIRMRPSYNIGRITITPLTLELIRGKPSPGKSVENAEKIIKELIPPVNNSCNPLYIQSDSIKILKYFKAELMDRNMGDLNKYVDLSFYCGSAPPFSSVSLGTDLMEYRPQGIQAYVWNKRWVAAYIQNHDHRILSQMGGTLILSILFTIFIIFSFIYLLILILKQKRLAEMKDDFINNMTHELKTPIAIISAAVEGMQNFNALDDKEKTNRYLETSRKELNRLNDLVTKVLHMASYEKKDIQLSLEKIEVDELMNDLIGSFKTHSDKALNITYKNVSSVKYLEADPVHFRNAVSNLIDNAIKYSGDQADIEINCFTEDKYVKISIADKGIGIPASQLNHIFEKFHRVPTGNIHNVKGTGLGLSYVKYIIERQGGTVSVKSELSKGSEFIISLPSAE